MDEQRQPAIRKGWFLFERKRYEEALREATQAIAADPGSTSGLFLAGLCSLELGREGEAERFGRELLGADPTAPAGHVVLALRLFEADPRAAERHIREALSLQPDEPAHHTLLAQLLGHVGRLEDAITVAHRGLKLDPNHLLSLHTLQALYRLNDEPEMAEKYGARALAVDPEAATGHLELGLNRLGKGQRTQARGNLLQALRIDPASGKDLEAIAHEQVRSLPVFKHALLPPTRPWPLVAVWLATPLLWLALSLLLPALAYVAGLAALVLLAGYLHLAAFHVCRRLALHRLRRGQL